jgi:putative aldouronate transport system substrate-binding protein
VNIDEALAFLDILCDPDALKLLVFGPDGGGILYSEGNNMYLTDRFLEYIKENGQMVGYPLDNGETFDYFNTGYLCNAGVETSFEDGKGNKRIYDVMGYSEYQEIAAASDNFDAWKKTMGYNSWRELLADKNALCESSKIADLASYLQPDDQMKLLISSLNDVIQNASWKMVYAESDAEFEAAWNEMVSDCEGLGANQVIEWASAIIMEQASKK